MKTIILLFILSLSLSSLQAQTDGDAVSGIVYGSGGEDKEVLNEAVIKWINTSKGVVTDSDGKFELPKVNITDNRIIVSYVGYTTDTIDVSDKTYIEVVLNSSFSTQQIVVEGERSSSYISDEETKTEVITQFELKKDACCDLSGCFGKNASVDVAVTDILTNTKEIKVLGLEGAYTQILVDNMPLMTGLITKYGVSSVPGTLINKITISKGSNSVIQGYESISGIMNVLLKDYSSSERLLVNGFMNGGLEKQFNLNGTSKLGKWNTLLAFQTVQEMKRMDENGDSFLDAPLITRYMLYNKWKYGTSEVSDETNVTLAAKYLDEYRIGGQKNYDSDNNLGSSSVYGQTVDIESGELYGRLSQVTGEESQMKAFLTGSYFNQVSYYGTTLYHGKQRNFFANALYEFPFSKRNFLRLGASYKYEKIDEDISFLSPVQKTYAGVYSKEESIPGLFSEASMEFSELDLSLIGGFRLDFHNEHDVIATPRFLVRYQLTDKTVIRASVGTGFRTANLFSEYPSILASGKDVIFSSKINPERMVNYGVDVLQYIDAGPVSGNVNFDFYRTDFSNKVLPEYDVLPSTVVFSNFERAASNVLQIESNLTILRNIDFKLAYKLIDLYYYNKQGIKLEQPFNAKHRIISGLSYNPSSRSWIINFTLQWFGKQKLPSTQSDPVQYQRPDESDAYTLINGQFTKNFENFEVYVGIENILDFTQKDPIISANNPFSKYFDTSFVWGPTRGREFYVGFRFSLQ